MLSKQFTKLIIQRYEMSKLMKTQGGGSLETNTLNKLLSLVNTIYCLFHNSFILLLGLNTQIMIQLAFIPELRTCKCR